MRNQPRELSQSNISDQLSVWKSFSVWKAFVVTVTSLTLGAGLTTPVSAMPEQLPGDNGVVLPRTSKTSTTSTSTSSSSSAAVVRTDFEAAQWQRYGVGADGVAATGRGIIVAVVGDGVDDRHPDLSAAVLTGWDATTKKPLRRGAFNGFGSAGSNGTFQATLIAARADRAGIVGIAPEAKILPVVVDSKGELSDRAVADGVAWAVANGAKLITLSLGVSEGVTNSTTTATCAAIAAARKAGVLTFVPAWNDEVFSEASFRPAGCEKAVVVAAVAENLTNKISRALPVVPAFAAPSLGVVGGNNRDETLPYEVLSSTLWAPASAAAAAALLWSNDPSASAESVLARLRSSATDLGDRASYGAGLLDVAAAISGKVRTVEDRRRVLAESSVPVIVDANRSGDGRSAITWEPPVDAVVNSYDVVVTRWSGTTRTWVSTSSNVPSSTVRAVIEAELGGDSYVTVVANTASGPRSSLPTNYTWYNPTAPTHAVDADLAAVTKGSVRWVDAGIEVTVDVNDSTRNWDAFVIDPATGDPVKRVTTNAGTLRRVIQVSKFDDLRNQPVAVSAGMGRNGVDMLLLPEFGLTATVLAAGKTRAGVYGRVNCVNDDVFNCGSRELAEGTTVSVLDGRTGTQIATAKIRSDLTFSVVWKQKSSTFDVVVVAGDERSMRRTGKFWVR